MMPANSRCTFSAVLSSWSCQFLRELWAHAGNGHLMTPMNKCQPVLSAQFEVVKLFVFTVVHNIKPLLSALGAEKLCLLKNKIRFNAFLFFIF